MKNDPNRHYRFRTLKTALLICAICRRKNGWFYVSDIQEAYTSEVAQIAERSMRRYLHVLEELDILERSNRPDQVIYRWRGYP